MSRPDALAWPAVAGGIDVLPLRRAALWILLLTKLTAGWGLGWDIRWHLLIGRDSFWIAPHVLTYASVALAGIASFGVVAVETRGVRGGVAPSGQRMPAGSIQLFGLVGTRGFHLAWLGIAVMLVAAPIDDLWHRLFGIDVTLWSPPHLLGLLGAQVNTLACLAIAREAWPAGDRARILATLLGTTFLFGTFAISADPSWRIAFLHGGLFFFTWPVLGASLFAFSLVLGTRLTALRWAPIAIVAFGVVVQLSIFAVANLGFTVLKPVPVIQEVLTAEESTSPIAVAHEMARRNGTTVGGSWVPRLFPLFGALLIVAADARRRPLVAALAFGAGLFAVAFPMMLRSPALAHVRPDAPAAALGLVLTLAAAAAGGWLAARLADRIAAR
ncbi:MAG TPA: hypothetical protein VGT02_06385 [Methylomirabilota bacterium]|jgi:hypothetical protein|nr:hypothetical protein [Methylomirabilota bacterium]